MGNLEVEKFRQRFLEILANQEAFDAQLDDRSSNQDPLGDEIDQAQVERDRSLNLKLKGRDLFYVKKIKEALNRIELGTFGECQECGCNIELGRLDARPTATYCIKCKEESEREEVKIPYLKRSHTSGQALTNENTQISLNS